jgi:hypothetical protein
MLESLAQSTHTSVSTASKGSTVWLALAARQEHAVVRTIRTQRSAERERRCITTPMLQATTITIPIRELSKRH